jgi:hypothetical protein
MGRVERVLNWPTGITFCVCVCVYIYIYIYDHWVLFFQETLTS